MLTGILVFGSLSLVALWTTLSLIFYLTRKLDPKSLGLHISVARWFRIDLRVNQDADGPGIDIRSTPDETAPDAGPTGPI